MELWGYRGTRGEGGRRRRRKGATPPPPPVDLDLPVSLPFNHFTSGSLYLSVYLYFFLPSLSS